MKKKHRICVFNFIVSKFGVDRLTEYISVMNDMNINHCIVIYDNGVTPAANKVLYDTSEIVIELFNYKELRYNITKHRLVPQHAKLSPNDAKIFKKKYGNNFSIMFTTDPISRFYRYKKGDIIKIYRLDNTISYSIVCV